MVDQAYSHVTIGTVNDVKFSADGSQLYVSTGGSIVVIDVVTGAVTGTYEIGGLLRGFDISPNGNYLSVVVHDEADPSAAAFVRIDLANSSMENFTFGSSYGHQGFFDLAYLSNGNILLSHEGRGPLRIFNSGSEEFTSLQRSFGGGGTTLISSPDGDQVYGINSASQATFIFTQGQGLTAWTDAYDPYSGASLPRPIPGVGAISANGDTVVTPAGISDAHLHEIGALGYTFAGLTQGFAFSPDGRTLYACDPSGLIIVYDADTLQATAVIDSGRNATSSTAYGDVIQISSDGTHMAVITASGVQIVNLELAVPVATNGNDVLDGSGTLIGLDGNDILGGAGYQAMFGGRGDDVYYIDHGHENAFEFAGEGYDIVYTQVSAEIGDYVEELVFIGSGDASLTAGQGSQTLRGGQGDDLLDGGADDDIMVGGRGDDTYLIFQVGDTVVEEARAGYDTVETLLTYYELPAHFERLQQVGSVSSTLIGNNRNNEIIGYALSDYLVGRDGHDALFGQYGDDLLEGNSGNDNLNGDGGEDFLNGGLGNDVLNGGSESDALTGDLGDDMLNGGSGVDLVSYFLADAGVVVSLTNNGAQDTRSEGFDTLVSIEDLEGSDYDDRLEGNAGANFLEGRAGNDVLLGGGGNDRLFGITGNDRLSGGAGFDWLTGGEGNDVYFVDGAGDSGDRVVEAAGEGRDTVWAASFYTLSENVENLYLRTGNWQGTGNALDNRIVAGNGNNVLKGLAGNDTLYGGTGQDTLNGGEGNDRLFGGVGQDSLSGGAGADRFIFKVEEDFGPDRGDSDILTDFVRAEGDRIGLAGIDAITGTIENDAFTFIGAGAFSNTAGELRYLHDNGRTIVEMDFDGDGAADLFLRLDGKLDLLASDFIF